MSFTITKKKVLIAVSILVLIAICFGSFLLGQKYTIQKIAEVSLTGSIQYDEADEKLIIDSAKQAIKENSAEDIKYFLIADRMVADWVVFQVYPLNNDFDNAQLYLKFNNGDPIVFGPATSFPGLDEEYPELFR